MPAVSKGLPPPLPSLRFVWELPADVVVLVDDVLLDFDVVCAAFCELLVFVALLEEALLEVVFCFVLVVFATAEGLDVSAISDVVSFADSAVLVLLTIVALGVLVVVCCGVVHCCVVEVVLSSEVVPGDPRFLHNCCGPRPARYATMRFCPDTPCPPHALRIGWTNACNAD